MLETFGMHCGSENRMQRPVEVTFQENSVRNWVGYSTQNLSIINYSALYHVGRDEKCKAGHPGNTLFKPVSRQSAYSESSARGF